MDILDKDGAARQQEKTTEDIVKEDMQKAGVTEEDDSDRVRWKRGDLLSSVLYLSPHWVSFSSLQVS